MTLTTNQNYLQPTAFKLIIDRKKFGNLEYFAQSVSHPSVSIASAPLPYSRVTAHMPGDKLTFGEFTATIILDEDLASYEEMYEWMLRLVNEPYMTRTFGDSDEFPSMVDISVALLTSHNNVAKTIRYIDCVPTNLGDINLMATSGAVTYITFPVTFAFTRFELK
jgi:hypothetical protein